MHGYVKWYNDKKGFGFIKAEDNQEYFVHITDVLDTDAIADGVAKDDSYGNQRVQTSKGLLIGQHVSFMPSKNAKGIIATRVVAAD